MAFSDDFSGFTPNEELSASADWTAQYTAANELWVYGSGGDNYLVLENPTLGTDQQTYLCPDQGSADCYVQGRLKGFQAMAEANHGILRYTDSGSGQTYAGWSLRGTGSAGLRIESRVNGGSVTTRLGTQGVSDGWVRLEAESDVYTLFTGGAGSTPGTWVEEGSWTDSTPILSTTSTEMGVSVSENINSGEIGETVIQDFEAGALGGAATTSLWIPDPRWEEPNLLIPGKKPTGPVVVDWGHPLLKNALCLVIGGHPYELVTGQPITPVFNNNERIASARGGTGFYCGNGAVWKVDCKAAENIIANKSLTFIALTTYLGTYSNIFSVFGDSVTGAGINSFSSPDNIFYKQYTPTVTIGKSISANDVVMYVGRGDMTQANTLSGTTNVFPEANSLSTTTHAVGAIGAQTTYYIGGDHRQETTRYMEQVFHLGLIVQRYMSEDEIARISRNPYQFLIPA